MLVISWESGQVLDYEVLSKHCMACSHWKETDKESQKNIDWWQEHKDPVTSTTLVLPQPWRLRV